ncbi:MAG: hypothetical protein H0T43_05220 [Solirubrobacterales bacterium]|nr:hypothetical protein [Solirubrobacterales bacterium]
MSTAETYFAQERLETLMLHVALATVARYGLLRMARTEEIELHLGRLEALIAEHSAEITRRASVTEAARPFARAG